jgi:dihydrodipicolinate synthase/N-acetylneuraminate lyase
VNRDDVDWRGYWTASPTPFGSDGSLDENSFAALLDLYVGQGIAGVLVNGSTGEWFSQSVGERQRVVEIAVDQIGGRIPVVAGVTAMTATEACALARHARDVGASGVLATVPPYVHPDPEESLEFYRRVSGATDLPFMVYNWPRGVGVDLDEYPGLMARLAALENVVAIKDSSSHWSRLLQTIEEVAGEVRVFGSFVHRRGLAILTGLGGDGDIDGGCLGAPFAVPYYRAVHDGDLEAARQWADRYVALSSALIRRDYSAIYASPVPQLKAAMRLLGQPGGEVREPLLPLLDATKLAAIAETLGRAGLTVTTDLVVAG